MNENLATVGSNALVLDSPEDTHLNMDCVCKSGTFVQPPLCIDNSSHHKVPKFILKQSRDVFFPLSILLCFCSVY